MSVTYSPTQIQTTTKITSSVSRTDPTTFDGLGRVLSQTVVGAETDYTYDTLGRHSTVSIKNSGQQDTYSYDSIGRVTKITHADSNYSQISYNNNCSTFTDESGRVRRVCADGLGRTNQVVEDPSGLNYIRTCYAYDSLHRLTSNSYSNTTPSATFYYDQTSYNGLTISNGLGRQTGMSDDSGATAWSFDTMGRVLSQEKTISGITKIAGYGYTSGSAVNEYIFFDGMRIARRDSSGNVYYYFGNTLGSAAITAATGSICYDADFYPFGGELAFTNTCGQNYKFADMERDSPSGLNRTTFRQYSSNYGRWLSPDPYNGSYDISTPQSLNRYAYVLNNPTNLVDPMSMDYCDNSLLANVAGSGGAWVPPCQIAPGIWDASYSGPAVTIQSLQNQTWQSIDSFVATQTGNAEYAPLPTGLLNGFSNDAGGPGDIVMLGNQRADIAFKDIVNMIVADWATPFGKNVLELLSRVGDLSGSNGLLSAIASQSDVLENLNEWKSVSAPAAPSAPCSKNAGLAMNVCELHPLI